MTRARFAALLVALVALICLGILCRPSAGPLVHAVALGSGAAALLVDAPGHRALVVSGDGRSVGVVDTRTGTLVHPVQMGQAGGYEPRGTVALDARAGRVFALDASGARVNIFAASSGALLHTEPVGPAPLALTVDARTGRAFVLNSALHAGGQGSVSVLDVASGQFVRTVRVGYVPNAIALDSGLNRVFVSDPSARIGAPGQLQILDATRGTRLRTVAVGYNGAPLLDPTAIFVDQHVRRAYVATNDGVSIVDTQHGRLMGTVRGTVLASDPRRGRLFVLAPTRAVQVIDGRSGRLLHRGATLAAATAGGALVEGRTGHVVAMMGRQVLVLDGRTGLIVRTVALGQSAFLSDVDERSAIAFLIVPATFDTTGGAFTQAGRLLLVDLRAGTVRATLDVGLAPIAAVMDGQTGRAIVLSAGGPVRTPGDWAWLPTWVRTRVPFVPQTRWQIRTVRARVSIVDPAR